MGKSGWTGVALLLLVAMPMVFIPLLIQTVLGDREEYGVVPVPGSRTVELPAEQVTVFFRETGVFGENEGANRPDGFEFAVVPEGGGEALDVDGVGFFAFSSGSDSEAYDPIGVIEPPRKGPYSVSSGSETGDAQSPALTFGTGSSGRLPRFTQLGLVVMMIAIVLLVIGVVRSSRRKSQSDAASGR